MIRDILAATAFLTRLPLGHRLVFEAKDVARSERWFPLVGALLGAIYAGGLWLCTPVFPALVTAVLLTALDACLTGAMHLDGLADTADGFGGGSSREDVLRIMRDHAIGAYGAVALVLAISLKILAVAALVDARRAIPAIVLAPVLGRWIAVLLSATQHCARPATAGERQSAGSPTRFVGRTELAVATGTTLAAAAILDWRRGLAACTLVAVGATAWAWQCRRRIGGVTGDTLGAAVAISECIVLLMFVATR